MTWDEVIECKELQNLPFKIELNRWGQVIMSPAYNPHGYLQAEVIHELKTRLPRWRIAGECSVQTSDGVRAPDVAAISPERYAEVKDQRLFQLAPDICVEIRSDSNTGIEMDEKRRLYFERGAREVWIVNASRKVAFYNPAGVMERSALCPDFPLQLPEE
ncbi:MAG: Uma2 family endonuclease [Verrucomicrobia bacterium]|nr:Uma2 family endonuclease [Verrucomicrobiota bacterium]